MIIDLNSDLGESFGNYSIGNDAEVMKYITSANIACGFHAGDPLVIENTIKTALENNVAIGAHPGYPDLVGFGRRSMIVRTEELGAMTLYQVGALKSMTEALGGKLIHVKPHGALYNDLSINYTKATVFAEAICKIDPELIVVGLSGSVMLQAARDAGLKVANEVFADRAYNDDGSLLSRVQEGAVIHDSLLALKQVIQILKDKTVQTINGNTIPIQAQTICVHGDNIKAWDFVKLLSEEISQQKIKLKSLNKRYL